MALSPPELYHTEFVRSARAVGVLWGVCTVCLAVLQVVVLVQPAWVVTTETSSSASGTLGLFQVCVEGDWPGPDCQGSPSALAPLPAFQTPAVLSCGWLQLTAGVCLSLACLLFLDSWDCAEMRALCGDRDLQQLLGQDSGVKGHPPPSVSGDDSPPPPGRLLCLSLFTLSRGESLLGNGGDALSRERRDLVWAGLTGLGAATSRLERDFAGAILPSILATRPAP
ncbi:unnamed protein product [Gadus morhua 'NCC']